MCVNHYFNQYVLSHMHGLNILHILRATYRLWNIMEPSFMSGHTLATTRNGLFIGEVYRLERPVYPDMSYKGQS